MEELAEKLSGILASPEGQEQLKNIASLLGGANAPDLTALFGTAEEKTQEPAAPPLDPAALAGLGEIFRGMQKNDKNTDLLLALKPHFGERRQERVDQAIKLLRLISMLPALQQSGILNGIL